MDRAEGRGTNDGEYFDHFLKKFECVIWVVQSVINYLPPMLSPIPYYTLVDNLSHWSYSRPKSLFVFSTLY